MTHLLLLALGICSPFDKGPDAGDMEGRLADGGISPDQAACGGGRVGCPSGKCEANRNVGAPVDTLNGFAWLDRSDVNLPQPWGPAFAFTRHYSTGWRREKAAPASSARWAPGGTTPLGPTCWALPARPGH